MLKRGLTITAVAAAPAGVPHSLWGEPIVPVPGIQLYTIPRPWIGLRKVKVGSLPRANGNPRIGASVGRVGKFICIGLNYSDHAAEAGMN
jgi:hypothetical protein